MIKYVLSLGKAALLDAGIDSAQADSELLLAHVLGVSRGELKQQVVLGGEITDDDAASFIKLIKQRANRKPLQHLTGKAPFRYLELNVGPGVFIPRPETELVAGAAIDWLRNQHRATDNIEPLIAVDLCTGSAAIALAIATECPNVRVYAVELNDAAHQWAARNIGQHTGPASGPPVNLIKGDARTALSELNGQVSVVISNPPYLAPDEVPPDAEVHAHDPAMALYGQGADGLEIPRGIVATAARLLRPGGLFVMEHGDTQSDAVIAIVNETSCFTNASSFSDLTGRDRFITAIRICNPENVATGASPTFP